jgi:uncharacterized membrane protein YqhA
MIKFLLKFRYFFIVAVVFLMLNSIFFLIAGVKKCITGYIEFVRVGFSISEANRPGVKLLEGLDFFMAALVFMIFGLGMGRLFLFDSITSENLPVWLRIKNVSELKFLLWETILITLVIFLVTHLIKSDIQSWEILIFPCVILILSLALFFLKFHNSAKDK